MVLYSFFPKIATTRLDVAHWEMQYITLTFELSSSSSSFREITAVFPYANCKLSHLCCCNQSLIWSSYFIIHNENSSSRAIGQPYLYRILSLSKVFCFSTSTVSYFLTFPSLSFFSLWGVARQMGLHGVFCASFLGMS